MYDDLKGKRVLVTGGAACANLYSREAPMGAES